MRAGILTEGGLFERILSPLLAEVALSVLDEHFVTAEGGPLTRRSRGSPGAGVGKPRA